MFERFTERARKVVVHAQDEARALKHGYIGTEPILLGLLQVEEGLAARVLVSLGITVEGVREQVVRLVGEGDEVTTGQVPFTPRAKEVLVLALREAESLRHNHIGAEHILLGLAREKEGVAAHILHHFDADAAKIRAAVADHLVAPSRAHPVVPPSPAIAERRLDVESRLPRRGVPRTPGDRLERSRELLKTIAPAAVGVVVGGLIGWLIWG